MPITVITKTSFECDACLSQNLLPHTLILQAPRHEAVAQATRDWKWRIEPNPDTGQTTITCPTCQEKEKK
jgi:hypothetical protein